MRTRSSPRRRGSGGSRTAAAARTRSGVLEGVLHLPEVGAAGWRGGRVLLPAAEGGLRRGGRRRRRPAPGGLPHPPGRRPALPVLGRTSPVVDRRVPSARTAGP